MLKIVRNNYLCSYKDNIYPQEKAFNSSNNSENEGLLPGKYLWGSSDSFPYAKASG